MPAGESSLVLLVEDEPLLLRAAARILQHVGYEVLQAASGEDALALIARRGARPDLVVTDIGLRGMDGRATAAALREGLPGLRVLFMSGRADLESLRRALSEDARAAVLAKPFSRDELVAAVAALFAARA